MALALLGVCLAAGVAVLSRGTLAVEARGAAQAWQAAATWAQSGAVWSGTDADLGFDSGRLTVHSGADSVGGDLGAAAPSVIAVPNIASWRQGGGVTVGFGAGTANPDSAGSLYFRTAGADYRVTVRLESGLTVRTRMEVAP